MKTKSKISNFLPLLNLILLFILLSPSYIIHAQDWTPLDPPNTPEARYGHSLVTLPDGRVVMFGGQGENNTLFNDLNIFRDTWTMPDPEGDLPPKRKNHSAVLAEEKMYVYGGSDHSQIYDDLWSYDFSQNSWTLLSPSGNLPEARESSSAFYWNDNIYIAGGQNDSQPLSDLWLYNIAENTWTKRGHTPTNFAGAAISTYQDNLYFLGYSNWTIVQDLNTLQVRDFQSSPMPGPRQYSAYVQQDNIAYLLGGQGSVLQDMWSFDMATETWSQLVDLPIPLKYASAAIYDNQIFLCGGLDDNDAINSLSWVYRFAPSAVTDDIVNMKFELNNNYPNPFNPSTKISYSIVKRGLVTLTVFNSLGKQIDVLVNEIKEPGSYEIIFDAKNLASGIYFYTLKNGGQSQTKKMVLLR